MVSCKDLKLTSRERRMDINTTTLTVLPSGDVKNKMEKYYHCCPSNIPDVACVSWP